MRSRTTGIILVIILLLIVGGVWYYNVTKKPNIFGDFSSQMKPSGTSTAMNVGTTTSTGSTNPAVAYSNSGSYGTPSYVNSPGNIPSSDTNPQTVISLDDNTREIHVRYGRNILLKLGDMDWSVRVSDPDIIRRIPNIAVIRGAQGVYETERVGVTTISAEGRPVCLDGQACAQYIVNFYVTLVVDP